MFGLKAQPPAAMLWLSGHWERFAIVLSVLVALLSISMTLIINLWRVRDSCSGYPLSPSSKCPFSTTTNGATCLLGSSILPATGPRKYLYFAPSYSPTCDMALIVSVFTLLFCVVLFLVAVTNVRGGVALYQTKYRFGIAVAIVCGLFTFLNLATVSVATEGYNLLCAGLERKPCTSYDVYNPITVNCLPMAMNITPCTQLSATSVIGGLRVSVAIGWILFAVHLLLFVVTVLSSFTFHIQRTNTRCVKERGLPLKTIKKRSDTVTTFLTSPSTNFGTYQPQDIGSKSSPPTSLSRLVEEKYHLPPGDMSRQQFGRQNGDSYRSSPLEEISDLRPDQTGTTPEPYTTGYPTGIPDQMSYEPETRGPRYFPLPRGSISTSTNV